MNTFKIITDPIQRTVIYYPGTVKPVFDWTFPVLYILVNRDYHPEEIRALRSILSQEEQERSQRFRFHYDRDSYVIVHGVLRLILGHFTGIPPNKIEILYNRFGKPYTNAGDGSIFFNMSHSSGVSVLSFCKGFEIGVDVEKIDPGFDFISIAQQYFSKRENKYISVYPINQAERFYELWTRKEAFLKAIGIGITEHLGVEVSESRNYFHLNGEARDLTFKSSGFVMNTLTFKQTYMITLAVDPVFGRIDAFIPGRKGKFFLLDPIMPLVAI